LSHVNPLVASTISFKESQLFFSYVSDTTQDKLRYNWSVILRRFPYHIKELFLVPLKEGQQPLLALKTFHSMKNFLKAIS
jgi:hypothetical protein